jgi:transposase, IS5 family
MSLLGNHKKPALASLSMAGSDRRKWRHNFLTLGDNSLEIHRFEEVKSYLEEQGFLLAGGSIVDATIIHVPLSTKNKDKQHDPEMSSTKKGNTWDFGMKAHISVDSQSGLIHTVGIIVKSDLINIIMALRQMLLRKTTGLNTKLWPTT